MKAIAMFGCALILAALTFGATGLALFRPKADVEIINKSSRNLSNAYVKFGDKVCKWGSVIVGASKGYLLFPHPITADAELHWSVDENQISKTIDLRAIYSGRQSGCLTFIVFDGRVDVTFKKEK